MERRLFAALVLLILSPTLVPGVWHPLAHVLHATAPMPELVLFSSLIAIITCLGARWRPAVALLIGLAACWFGGDAAGIAGFAGTLTAVALFDGFLFSYLQRELPAELDGLRTRRPVASVFWALAGFAAVYGITRISIFIGDATQVGYSLIPDNVFFIHHSCLTAYVEATRLAIEGVSNLYDPSYWPDLTGGSSSAALNPLYAPFHLDAYAYPPPFLLLTLALHPFADFACQRAVWFSFNSLFYAYGLWVVARWIGGSAGLRALLLAPLLWMTPPVLALFQVGNAHAFVTVVAMLALVAFETRRTALGGALLAFAIVAKISPGLVVVVFLMQRRFREILWTAGFGVLYGLLGLLLFGPAPTLNFIHYELPALESGDALRFLAGPDSVPFNLSPFGIPFKLMGAGISIADPWSLGHRLNQLYSLLVIGAAALSARKSGPPRVRAEMWAALLTLGALRSALSPGYVLIAWVWLLTFRAIEVRNRTTLIIAVLIAISTTNALPGNSPSVLLFSIFHALLLLGLLFHALLRKPPAETAP